MQTGSGHLSQGDELRLKKWSEWLPDDTDMYSSATRQYFPEGTTPHGTALLTSEFMDNNTIIREFAFEAYRREFESKYPSRFQSVFACDSLDCLEQYATIHCNPGDYDVYTIETDAVHGPFDIHQLGKGVNMVGMFDSAVAYWRQMECQHPLLEYLIEPPAVVGQQETTILVE